jgi:hypothetical protein
MEPHRILASHTPMRHSSWWTQLLGRASCRTCGQRWPCHPHQDALETLVPTHPPYTSPYGTAAWSRGSTVPMSTVGQPLTTGQATLYGQGGMR